MDRVIGRVAHRTADQSKSVVLKFDEFDFVVDGRRNGHDPVPANSEPAVGGLFQDGQALSL
jgi:hypothetical protein